MSATSGPPSPAAAVPPAEAFAVMGGSSVSHSLPGVGPPASTSSSRVVSSEGEEGNSGSEGDENPFASSPEKSGGGGENGGGAAGDLSPRWGPAAAEEPGAAAAQPQQQQPQALAPPNNPGGNPGVRGVHRHHHGHQQHHGFGPTLYARPEDSASHITVSDPVTQTEGMNKKYISYRVECHPRRRTDDDGTAVGGASAQLPVSAASDVHSAVHRRYNDFHWLSSQLRRERPGAVVPPIPEKQAVSRFDPEFVEERRAGLEKFLRRVAVHAELMDAECLGTFLRSDDLTFQAAKKKGSGGGGAGGAGAGQREGALSPDHQINIAPLANNASSVVAATVPAEPKKKNKLKNWFQETTTALSRDLVASPDDHLFEEIGRYVDDLEKAVKKCHHEAERLVKKRRDENGMYIELGKALSQLSGAADGTGADSASAGTLAAGVGLGRPAAVVADASSSSLAPLCSDAAEAELTKFLDPLGDHLRTVQSVRSALQQRQNRRLTYTTSLNTVTTKNAQMMKLRGQTNPNSAGSQMKLYDAELSLSRAQQAAESSRIEYEAVSGRVLREVDRFKAEGAKNVRATLAEYCAAQAEFHRRMEGAWGELVPRLGEIDLDAHVPTTAAAGVAGVAGAGAMGGSVGVAGAAAGAVPPIAAGNGGAPLGSHAAPPPQQDSSAAAAYVPTGMAAALHPGLGAHPLTQHSNGGVGGVGAGAGATTVVGGMQYRDTTGIDWSS